MVAVVEALDRDFRTFAPNSSSPVRSIYRMYRDTRFSGDKTPLKTHIAAVFPVRGSTRTRGPASTWKSATRVLVAGGPLRAAARRPAGRAHVPGRQPQPLSVDRRGAGLQAPLRAACRVTC